MTAKKKAADKRVPFNVRIPGGLAKELVKLARQHCVSQGQLVEAMYASMDFVDFSAVCANMRDAT